MEIKILIFLALYAVIILTGELLSKKFDPFLSRKVSHVLCGLLSSLFPFFLDFKSVIYLSSILILLVISTKVLNIFKGIELSEKKNWGTLYFPIGILCTTILFWNYNPLIFSISILILGISDPLAAVIGKRYGNIKFYIFSHKSLEGSLMFFISTFVIMMTSILILKNSFDVKDFVILIIGSAVVSGVEAASFKGTDNIFIPLTSAATLVLLLQSF